MAHSDSQGGQPETKKVPTRDPKVEMRQPSKNSKVNQGSASSFVYIPVISETVVKTWDRWVAALSMQYLW